MERINHSMGWTENRSIYSVRFEDLIGAKGEGDPLTQPQTIKDMLDFLGIEYDNKKIDLLCKNIFYKKARTFHSGQIGKWKKEFSPEIYQIMNKEMESRHRCQEE